MFSLANIVMPETIEEAYNILMKSRQNIVLGGCAFLRLGSRRFGTGVDLSQLNLAYIHENDEFIEIGATTTFRMLETSFTLHKYFNGIVPKAVSNIIGVQFRSIVMVGASVYARYGFSDLLTALLALDAQVELYKGGRMSLESFMDKPYEKDILTRVLLPKNARLASYQDLRSSASDFPILNAAVSKHADEWKIVVGARPLKAAIACQASNKLSGVLDDDTIAAAAKMAAEELSFGTNMRGSAEYRQMMCEVLVKRAVREVLQCK